ncbi:MAG TPA: YajQ family cyclic di-GMP-binding protein [Fimbriimonadaceae bacterium]|nr:YajQ family cyclic di-GMP-binding protein [Fimbriimonadaceae bacterium]
MAAKEFSFDIVSQVDKQEVRNAVDQAQRELSNRYDLKGTKCEIQFEKDEITLIADDEFRMDQIKDILTSKLIKRGIDIRHLEYGKAEPGSGLTIRQKVEMKQGISQDKAKPLIKQIKDKGLKVQAQIQGEQVRVAGKDKDELQKTIAFVKGLDLDFPVDFVNYR